MPYLLGASASPTRTCEVITGKVFCGTKAILVQGWVYFIQSVYLYSFFPLLYGHTYDRDWRLLWLPALHRTQNTVLQLFSLFPSYRLINTTRLLVCDCNSGLSDSRTDVNSNFTCNSSERKKKLLSIRVGRSCAGSEPNTNQKEAKIYQKRPNHYFA